MGTMGTIRESPEPHSNGILRPFRRAADAIEASGLEYTIIRPGWFDNGNDSDYELTRKGEEFGGMGVSRESIARLIIRLVTEPAFGINRPER